MQTEVSNKMASISLLCTLLLIYSFFCVKNGLSLSVFPLWRIHNTTGFPLELHLSSQEEGPNFITLLGIGDSLDNFSLLDGSSYSGDFDEAMISLSEGKI